MDGFKQMNDFFDIIDEFNKQGIKHIIEGDIKGAIEMYKLKNKFIGYAYHYDLITNERLSTMITDNSSIIRTLLKGVNNCEDNK